MLPYLTCTLRNKIILLTLKDWLTDSCAWLCMNANLSVPRLQVPRLMVSGHHLQQEVLLPRCHLQRRHRGNDCRRDQRPDQSAQRGEMFSPYYMGAYTKHQGFYKNVFFLCGDNVTECVAGSVYPHLAGTYKQPGFILLIR